MESLILKPGEQLDTLLNGRQIIQNKEKFMFGIDAVLLSFFASSEIRAKDFVIDLGTGTGIIPLLLETSTKASHFTGLEVQEESAEMASRSIKINNLQEKINIIEGNLRDVSQLFPKHSFNVVITNPPYAVNKSGRKNDSEAKTIARHEILCNLEDVIGATDYLLQTHGKFFMIHRPSRLPEIFTLMNKYKLEPKRIQLIQPAYNKEANIVMIEGRKNASPELRIEPTLNVYKSLGEYSQEVKEIYKSFGLGVSGEALQDWARDGEWRRSRSPELGQNKY